MWPFMVSKATTSVARWIPSKFLDGQYSGDARPAMNRRKFLRDTTMVTSALLVSPFCRAAESAFPVVRTPEAKRKFKSPAVEKTIQFVRASIGNKELGWMFENCFPNTLDTTVDFEVIEGRPDTYVITGDIDAMWLRDSTAQVWPY